MPDAIEVELCNEKGPSGNAFKATSDDVDVSDFDAVTKLVREEWAGNGAASAAAAGVAIRIGGEDGPVVETKSEWQAALRAESGRCIRLFATAKKPTEPKPHESSGSSSKGAKSGKSVSLPPIPKLPLIDIIDHSPPPSPFHSRTPAASSSPHLSPRDAATRRATRSPRSPRTPHFSRQSSTASTNSPTAKNSTANQPRWAAVTVSASSLHDPPTPRKTPATPATPPSGQFSPAPESPLVRGSIKVTEDGVVDAPAGAEVACWALVGKKVWCAEAAGTVAVRAPFTGHKEREIALQGKPTAIAVIPRCAQTANGSLVGTVVCLGFASGAMQFLHAETAAVLALSASHRAAVRCLAVPKGVHPSRFVCSGGDDGVVLLTAAAAPFALMCTVATITRPVTALVVTQARLYVGVREGTVRIWNVPTGKQRVTQQATLAAHEGAVTALELSGSGPVLWSAGADAQLAVWQLSASATTPPTRVLVHSDKHTAAVTSLRQIGDKLWAASSDGTATVYTARECYFLARIQLPSPVRCLLQAYEMTHRKVWACGDSGVALYTTEDDPNFLPASGEITADDPAATQLRALAARVADLEARNSALEKELAKRSAAPPEVLKSMDEAEAIARRAVQREADVLRACEEAKKLHDRDAASKKDRISDLEVLLKELRAQEITESQNSSQVEAQKRTIAHLEKLLVELQGYTDALETEVAQCGKSLEAGDRMQQSLRDALTVVEGKCNAVERERNALAQELRKAEENARRRDKELLQREQTIRSVLSDFEGLQLRIAHQHTEHQNELKEAKQKQQTQYSARTQSARDWDTERQRLQSKLDLTHREHEAEKLHLLETINSLTRELRESKDIVTSTQTVVEGLVRSEGRRGSRSKSRSKSAAEEKAPRVLGPHREPASAAAAAVGAAAAAGDAATRSMSPGSETPKRPDSVASVQTHDALDSSISQLVTTTDSVAQSIQIEELSGRHDVALGFLSRMADNLRLLEAKLEHAERETAELVKRLGDATRESNEKLARAHDEYLAETRRLRDEKTAALHRVASLEQQDRSQVSSAVIEEHERTISSLETLLQKTRRELQTVEETLRSEAAASRADADAAADEAEGLRKALEECKKKAAACHAAEERVALLERSKTAGSIELEQATRHLEMAKQKIKKLEAEALDQRDQAEAARERMRLAHEEAAIGSQREVEDLRLRIADFEVEVDSLNETSLARQRERAAEREPLEEAVRAERRRRQTAEEKALYFEKSAHATSSMAAKVTDAQQRAAAAEDNLASSCSKLEEAEDRAAAAEGSMQVVTEELTKMCEEAVLSGEKATARAEAAEARLEQERAKRRTAERALHEVNARLSSMMHSSPPPSHDAADADSDARSELTATLVRCSEAQQELTAARNELSEGLDANRSLKAELSDARTHRRSAVEQLSETASRLDASETARKTTEKELHEASLRLATAEHRYAQLQEEAERGKREAAAALDAAEGALVAQAKRTASAEEDQAAAREALRAAEASLRAERTSVGSSHGDLIKRVTELELAASTQEARHAAAQRAAAALEGEVDEWKAKLKAAEAGLRAERISVADFVKRVAELELAASTQEAQRAAAQRAAAALEGEVDEWKAKLKAAEASLHAERTSVGSTHGDFVRRVAELELAASAHEARHAAAQRAVADLEGEVDEWKAKLKAVSGRLEDAREEAERAEKKAAREASRADAGEARASELHLQLAVARDEVHAAKKRLDLEADAELEATRRRRAADDETEAVAQGLGQSRTLASSLEEAMRALQHARRRAKLAEESARETGAAFETEAVRTQLLQEKLDELEDSVSSLQADLHRRGKEADALRAELRTVKSKAADASKTRDELQRDAGALKLALDASQEEIDSLRSTIDSARAERDAAIGEVTAAHTGLELERKASARSLEVLEQEKKRTAAVGSSLDEALEQADRTLKKLGAEKSRADAAEARKRELERSIDDVTAQARELTLRENALREQVSELSADRERQTRSKAELEHELAALKSENRDLSAALAAARDGVEGALAEKADLDASAKRFEQSLDSSTKEVDRLKRDLAALESEKRRVEGALAEKATDLDASAKRFEQSLDSSTKEVDRLKRDLAALESEKRKVEGALAEKATDLDASTKRFEQSLDSSTKEVDRLKRELAAAHAALEREKREKEGALAEKATDLDASTKRFEQSIDSSSREVDRLKRELAAAHAALERETREMEGVRESLREATAGLETAVAQSEQLEAAKAELRAVNQSLRDEAARAEETEESLRATETLLREAEDRHRAELASLRGDLDSSQVDSTRAAARLETELAASKTECAGLRSQLEEADARRERAAAEADEARRALEKADTDRKRAARAADEEAQRAERAEEQCKEEKVSRERSERSLDRALADARSRERELDEALHCSEEAAHRRGHAVKEWEARWEVARWRFLGEGELLAAELAAEKARADRAARERERGDAQADEARLERDRAADERNLLRQQLADRAAAAARVTEELRAEREAKDDSQRQADEAARRLASLKRETTAELARAAADLAREVDERRAADKTHKDAVLQLSATFLELETEREKRAIAEEELRDERGNRARAEREAQELARREKLLEIDVEHEKLDAEAAKDETREARIRIDELERLLRGTAAECERGKSIVSQEEEDRRRLEAELSALRAELRKASEAAERERKAKDVALQRLGIEEQSAALRDGRLTDARDRWEKASQQLSAERQERADAERRADAAAARINTLEETHRSSVAELESRVEDTAGECAHLRTELDELRTSGRALEVELREAQQKLREAEEARAEGEDRLEARERDLRDAGEKARKAEEGYGARLEEAKGQWEQLVAEAADELRKARAQVRELAAKLEAAEKEREQARDELSGTHKKLRVTEQKVRDRNAALILAEKRAAELAGQAYELGAKLKRADAQAAKLRAEMDQRSEESATAGGGRIEFACAACAALREAVRDLEKRLRRAERHAAPPGAKDDDDDDDALADYMKGTIKRMGSPVSAERSSPLEAQHAELAARLQEAEAELSRQVTRATDAEASLQDAVDSLQKAVATARKLDEAEASLAAATVRAEAAEGELALRVQLAVTADETDAARQLREAALDLQKQLAAAQLDAVEEKRLRLAAEGKLGQGAEGEGTVDELRRREQHLRESLTGTEQALIDAEKSLEDTSNALDEARALHQAESRKNEDLEQRLAEAEAALQTARAQMLASVEKAVTETEDGAVPGGDVHRQLEATRARLVQAEVRIESMRLQLDLERKGKSESEALQAELENMRKDFQQLETQREHAERDLEEARAVAENFKSKLREASRGPSVACATQTEWNHEEEAAQTAKEAEWHARFDDVAADAARAHHAAEQWQRDCEAARVQLEVALAERSQLAGQVGHYVRKELLYGVRLDAPVDSEAAAEAEQDLYALHLQTQHLVRHGPSDLVELQHAAPGTDDVPARLCGVIADFQRLHAHEQRQREELHSVDRQLGETQQAFADYKEHSLERDEGASFEVSELKAALALLQDEVAQAREGENEQVAVNQKLLEAVDSSEAALDRMKHHCEQLKGRVEEQDAALRKAEAAAAGHHRDIEHKNDVILRLEATVAEHEGEIRKLRDSYQSEIRRFDRDLAKLQVESDEKIDETNRMIDAYERNLHETEARLQAEALWRQRAEADIISLKKSADENGMTVFDAVEHHRRHGGFDHPLQETRQTQQDHEFMARSRVDLVQELWDLFGDLSKAVKAVQPVVQSHSFKLQARKATHDTDLPRVLAAAHARAQAARTKCRGIVANFFTDVEKLHCGASVASFQPDARVAAAYGYHGLQSPPADEAQPRVKPPQARVAFSPAKDGRSDSKTRSLTTPSGSAADTAGDREASARPELARRGGPRAPVQGPAGMASAGVHVSYAYAGVTVQTSTASSPPMRSAVDPYRGRSASLNLQHTSPGMAMSAKAVSPPRPLTPTRGVFVDELAARGQGAISPTTTNESRRLNAEIAELEYKLAGMMTVPTTRVQHPVITPRRYDSTPVSTRSGTASTQPASFRAHSASTTTTTTTTLTAQRAPSGTVSSAITQPTSDDFARPALAHR